MLQAPADALTLADPAEEPGEEPEEPTDEPEPEEPSDEPEPEEPNDEPEPEEPNGPTDGKPADSFWTANLPWIIGGLSLLALLLAGAIILATRKKAKLTR